jgi:hypothetical protein
MRISDLLQGFREGKSFFVPSKGLGVQNQRYLPSSRRKMHTSYLQNFNLFEEKEILLVLKKSRFALNTY